MDSLWGGGGSLNALGLNFVEFGEWTAVAYEAAVMEQQ